METPRPDPGTPDSGEQLITFDDAIYLVEQSRKNLFDFFAKTYRITANLITIRMAELKASYSRKELREMDRLYRRRKKKTKPNPNRGITIRKPKDG